MNFNIFYRTEPGLVQINTKSLEGCFCWAQETIIYWFMPSPLAGYTALLKDDGIALCMRASFGFIASKTQKTIWIWKLFHCGKGVLGQADGGIQH